MDDHLPSSSSLPEAVRRKMPDLRTLMGSSFTLAPKYSSAASVLMDYRKRSRTEGSRGSSLDYQIPITDTVAGRRNYVSPPQRRKLPQQQQQQELQQPSHMMPYDSKDSPSIHEQLRSGSTMSEARRSPATLNWMKSHFNSRGGLSRGNRRNAASGMYDDEQVDEEAALRAALYEDPEFLSEVAKRQEMMQKQQRKSSPSSSPSSPPSRRKQSKYYRTSDGHVLKEGGDRIDYLRDQGFPFIQWAVLLILLGLGCWQLYKGLFPDPRSKKKHQKGLMDPIIVGKPGGKNAKGKKANSRSIALVKKRQPSSKVGAASFPAVEKVVAEIGDTDVGKPQQQQPKKPSTKKKNRKVKGTASGAKKTEELQQQEPTESLDDTETEGFDVVVPTPSASSAAKEETVQKPLVGSDALSLTSPVDMQSYLDNDDSGWQTVRKSSSKSAAATTATVNSSDDDTTVKISNTNGAKTKKKPEQPLKVASVTPTEEKAEEPTTNDVKSSADSSGTSALSSNGDEQQLSAVKPNLEEPSCVESKSVVENGSSNATPFHKENEADGPTEAKAADVVEDDMENSTEAVEDLAEKTTKAPENDVAKTADAVEKKKEMTSDAVEKEHEAIAGIKENGSNGNAEVVTTLLDPVKKPVANGKAKDKKSSKKKGKKGGKAKKVAEVITREANAVSKSAETEISQKPEEAEEAKEKLEKAAQEPENEKELEQTASANGTDKSTEAKGSDDGGAEAAMEKNAGSPAADTKDVEEEASGDDDEFPPPPPQVPSTDSDAALALQLQEEEEKLAEIEVKQEQQMMDLEKDDQWEEVVKTKRKRPKTRQEENQE